MLNTYNGVKYWHYANIIIVTDVFWTVFIFQLFAEMYTSFIVRVMLVKINVLLGFCANYQADT